MKLFTTIALLFICVTLTASCATTYTMYRDDLFEGRQLLKQEKYGEARNLFLKASTEERRAAPFAFAATASYKMNDLAAAEGYIGDAENATGRNYWYLRIMGYKALILLKERKTDEGMTALKRYIDYYRLVYPLTNIEQVEAMWKSGQINLPQLEVLLDEQITNYEEELAQAVTTGTGYYSTRPPPGAWAPRPSPD
jgi:hypothetical protein